MITKTDEELLEIAEESGIYFVHGNQKREDGVVYDKKVFEQKKAHDLTDNDFGRMFLLVLGGGE